MAVLMNGVRRYQDLIAWRLADDFHSEVVKLVRGSSSASSDFAFRDQLLDASSAVSKDITEGFLRHKPLVFASFLDYALGSLGEAESRVRDGITREYFVSGACANALTLARRCFTAAIRPKHSQLRYAKQMRRQAVGCRPKTK